MNFIHNIEIEGWMSLIDLLWLFNTVQNMNSVVEIGCWKGRSTYALLSGCPGMVYAVDHFLGSSSEPDSTTAEAKEKDIHSIFMNNIGDRNNLKLLKMNSLEASKIFEDKSVDMVFIDSDHHYEEVIADIKAWLPKTRKMICGHDIMNEPVRRAVTELLGEYRTSSDNIWYKDL